MSLDVTKSNWFSLTQRERDSAYNNNEAVPDAPSLIEERNQASAAFRGAHAKALDLPYGESQREQWDLYAGTNPQAPTLAFIHGGYWQRNRREDFAAMAEGALAMGWNVAICGYSLCPEVTLTRIVYQIHAALDWLAAHGAEHGLAGPIVLTGWSAGGHLTALGAEHPAVTAAIAISGIFELGPIRDTYLNAALKLTDEELVELSPMRRPVVQKPIAIAYGAAELPELCRQSRDFHRLRSEAQAPGPLWPIPGADHFRVLEALRRPDGALLRLAAELLR
ncbi:alpha/beta hydrolase [Roseococcus sp. SDR]|uniref:alpha/beta hydrolase n=1 Tax=Roseococcus sp. SDR TaxID=2835532 RepID=UPI001BCC08F8|nr:alpha/beta hydrolase [Roseococcus sp. SDR]MBS7791082.1 alpha/beta hydrolase [Roseococcus sp. SDR]MBV1846396.1 alpha/beta hydrolase [Roseococcus sp. SDR]